MSRNKKQRLTLTVRAEQVQRLQRIAELENRSMSNLIEVLTDAAWRQIGGCCSCDYITGERDEEGRCQNCYDKEMPSEFGRAFVGALRSFAEGGAR